VKRFALSLLVLLTPVGGARADVITYFQETGRFRHSLVNFDTATGESTLRAVIPGSERFFGLDVRPSDHQLFGIALAGGLWTINADTGAASLVGNTGLREPVGLTFQPGTGNLFVLSYQAGGSQLYRVDPSTADATLVGATGDVSWGVKFSPTGQLVGFDQFSTLFQLDPSSGRPTRIGGSGFRLTQPEDSAFTSGGNFFLNDFFGSIVQVDPASGDRRLVGSAVGPGPSILGLTFLPAQAEAVPAPPTLALLGLGAVALAGWRCRRKRAAA
jgi:DNA-binding beta-propeller fold protein YncE